LLLAIIVKACLVECSTKFLYPACVYFRDDFPVSHLPSNFVLGLVFIRLRERYPAFAANTPASGIRGKAPD